MWDWLRDAPVNVDYIEDEEGSEMVSYEAMVIDCALQNFMQCAAFQNGDELEWLSLVDDDWSWTDCDSPSKSSLREACDDAENRNALLVKPDAATETNANLYLMPSVAPPEMKQADEGMGSVGKKTGGQEKQKKPQKKRPRDEGTHTLTCTPLSDHAKS